MTRAKRQHYVPRHILKRFSVEDTKQVHVYDKATDKTFLTNITNVAVETGFYDFELDGTKLSIESSLASIESLVEGRLQKLVAARTIAELSLEDKTLLAVMVAVQLLRSKQYQLGVRSLSEHVRRKFAQMGQDLDSIPKSQSPSRDEEKIIIANLLRRAVPKLVPHIVDKIWILLDTPSETPFYLGDNPVVLHNERDFGAYGNLGFAVPGIEIYHPLTPTLTLALFCNSHLNTIRKTHEKYKDLQRLDPVAAAQLDVDPMFMDGLHTAVETGRALRLPGMFLARCNALQVESSTRYVFSQRDDFRQLVEILKRDPEQRRGVIPFACDA